MMTTSYDPEADAFYARFAPDGAGIVETREVAPGVMLTSTRAATWSELKF